MGRVHMTTSVRINDSYVAEIALVAVIEAVQQVPAASISSDFAAASNEVFSGFWRAVMQDYVLASELVEAEAQLRAVEARGQELEQALLLMQKALSYERSAVSDERIALLSVRGKLLSKADKSDLYDGWLLLCSFLLFRNS